VAQSGGGARRSRRFNSRIPRAEDFPASPPIRALKRAEARAPSDFARLNPKGVIFIFSVSDWLGGRVGLHCVASKVRDMVFTHLGIRKIDLDVWPFFGPAAARRTARADQGGWA